MEEIKKIIDSDITEKIDDSFFERLKENIKQRQEGNTFTVNMRHLAGCVVIGVILGVFGGIIISNKISGNKRIRNTERVLKEYKLNPYTTLSYQGFRY